MAIGIYGLIIIHGHHNFYKLKVINYEKRIINDNSCGFKNLNEVFMWMMFEF